MNKNDLDNFMSSIEAAVYLGVTYTRVNALRRSGKLLGTQIGSFWLYSKTELDQYKATRKTGRPKGYSPKRKRKEHHEQKQSEE